MMSSVRQYRIQRAFSQPLLLLLVALGCAAGSKAQEGGCEDFETAREELKELVAGYWDERPRSILHEVVEKSQTALVCATDDHEYALAYNYETWALTALGQHEEAHAVFVDFNRLSPSPQDSTLWSTMYRRHGAVLLRLGKYAESQLAYARALRFGEALPLDRHIELALAHVVALGQMAAFDEALERLDGIEALLTEHGETLAREDFDFLLGRTLLDRADVLGLRSIDRVSSRAADRDRAVVESRRAVDLLDGPGYETTQFRVIATQVLAEALRRTGHLEAAMSHYRTAVRAADEHGDILLRIQAWDDLGEGFLAGMESDSALAAFQHGIDLVLDTDLQYEARYLFEHLGEAYEQKGHLKEAEEAYRKSIARAERQRASLGTIDLAANAFADWQTPYRRLVGLYLQTGRSREAFALLEQTRARHLNDLRRDSRDLAHQTPAARARLDSLDAVIERLRAQLATASDPSGMIAARLDEAEAERYGPDATSASFSPPSLGEVQRALSRRGQTLVTYYLNDPSYAFVVTPETFHAVRLDLTEAAVDSLVESVGPLWQGEARVPTRRASEFDVATLHGLYRALFEPLRDLIPADAPLVVIPEGPLRQVPFAMLLEAPTRRFQYATAPFLLRRHPISTDLAVTFLTDTTAVPHRQAFDLVAFGRSDFSSSASFSKPALSDLPVVREELGALQSLFPDGFVAIDAKATESALNTHLSKARVIHLASHAEVDTNRPLYSHIWLWPDEGEDGQLYLYELAGRHLPADLVVLSGCSTARGQVLAGEGMVGLHYGFRAAGVATSLGTLWHVDDKASGALMERFYVHLRQGLSKDRALQQAQLDYLRSADGMRASPFYWAAPVLYGSPSPITWNSRPGLPGVAWMGIGGLLLLLAFALPRLSRPH